MSPHSNAGRYLAILAFVLAFVLAFIVPSACVFDSARRATTDVDLQAATAYVFRGQVMTDRPVLQAATIVDLPTRGGGGTSLRAWGNLDLTDHVGRAWFGPGHAGEFTEIDLSLRHTRSIGPIDVTAGLVHYSWANGEQFRFGPFPSTSEVLVSAGCEVAGLRPSATVHYDVDEAKGIYARADVDRTFELGRSTSLVVRLWAGWSNAQHSKWLYRTASSGFADAGGELRLAWSLDEVTTAHVALTGSAIVDDELRDWFRSRIDADNVWVTVGLTWRF